MTGEDDLSKRDGTEDNDHYSGTPDSFVTHAGLDRYSTHTSYHLLLTKFTSVPPDPPAIPLPLIETF